MPDTLPDNVARAIRRVLNDILRKTPAVNAEVVRIQELLDGGPLPDANGHPAAAPPPGAAPADTGAAKHYEVRDVDGEAKLLEHRHGSATPFAVPHAVYTAFAKTTAQHSGKRFELIFRRFSADHPDAKDYQGRVCFRFWQQRGLLEKVRGRYRVSAPPDHFTRATATAWREMTGASQS